ncbi:hypothetical protein C8Q75DRAFT_371463 [Abortiporus biennis]|nr:hypothetical protein C8Q75DRAFT_371463 [Abortiporus biennis]
MPFAPPMKYQTVDAMDSPHKFFTHVRNVIQVLERLSNKYQHVHGDIQPSNILCLPDGSTKLLLFDYAKDHGWNENKYRIFLKPRHLSKIWH